jgi:BirA family transcriptional regulator, biotin operon repressor / biotin---[acetyl-CoA-carboxylase] ligase
MSGSVSSAASLNIGLLERLREAAGEYVPIDELARGLATPAAADPAGDGRSRDRDRILADLEGLASFGFAIERHPYRGAAYIGPAERLCPDQIEHALSTIRIGRRIAVWSRLSSTNDLAAGACGSASNDGLVVLADEQTAGRGRLGRSWIAPPRSSILMSVLLFPPRKLEPSGPGAGPDAAWLTAMGAVATAEVVSNWIGREAAIKWPNDVRVDGRKIAGILVERPATRGLGASTAPATDGAEPQPPDEPGQPAVIGIGLNVNLEGETLPADLRARTTSIRIERGGPPLDRSEIARDLIRRLDRWYEAVRSLGYTVLNTAWRDRSEHLGRVVRIATPAGPRSGRLVDLHLHRGLTLVIERRGESDQVLANADRDAARRLIRLSLAEVQAIENAPLARDARRSEPA